MLLNYKQCRHHTICSRHLEQYDGFRCRFFYILAQYFYFPWYYPDISGGSN